MLRITEKRLQRPLLTKWRTTAPSLTLTSPKEAGGN